MVSDVQNCSAAPSAPESAMWAVGTDSGEFDWIAIEAADAEAARLAYAQHFEMWACIEDCPANREMPCDFCDAERFPREPHRSIEACRVPTWDGLATVLPRHWIEAGLGTLCERCGCECSELTGAAVVDGRALCDECLLIRKEPECR